MSVDGSRGGQRDDDPIRATYRSGLKELRAAYRTGVEELRAARDRGRRELKVAYETYRHAQQLGPERDQRRKADLYITGIPFGYDRAADGKTLLPNEDEQEVIRLMQKLRQDGLSYQKIADELNSHGTPTKSGKTSWRSDFIMRVLKRNNAPAK